MLDAFIRWLLTWLESRFDPEMRSRLAALDQRIAAAEAAEKEKQLALEQSQARLVEMDARLDRLDSQNTEIEKLINESLDRQKEIQAKADQAKANLDALGPDARLRVPL